MGGNYWIDLRNDSQVDLGVDYWLDMGGDYWLDMGGDYQVDMGGSSQLDLRDDCQFYLREMGGYIFRDLHFFQVNYSFSYSCCLFLFQSWLTGDVIACAIDCDEGTVTFYRLDFKAFLREVTF